jgi:hypothetical protein
MLSTDEGTIQGASVMSAKRNSPPQPDEPATEAEDEVEEASIESFPASDPPGWIMRQRDRKPEDAKDAKEEKE